MSEHIDSGPDKSPLPIFLLLALFPIYALGLHFGLGIRFADLVSIFTGEDGGFFLLVLALSLVPLLVIVAFGLIAIRLIVSRTHPIAGVVLYIVCCVLCLLIGIVIVPALVIAHPGL